METQEIKNQIEAVLAPERLLESIDKLISDFVDAKFNRDLIQSEAILENLFPIEREA